MASSAKPVTITDEGVTFIVEETIKPAGPKSYGKRPQRYREPARGHGTLEDAWKSIGVIEAMSPAPDDAVDFFTKQNLLVKAVHTAFFEHHPLILTPDIIWITIAQGLSNHVDQNAETLRDKFVSHEGTEDIEISRPGFVKGSPHNDWEGVFPEFASKIGEKTKDGIADLITANFSTTGPTERIVSQITLMDAMQHYFRYSMACGCGFPSITLKGTPEDWQGIRDKAAKFSEYDLDWWLEHLIPALDEFVAASKGEPNLDFWRSLCHINVGTSMPMYKPLTGWINVFFPYLNASGGRGWGAFDETEENKAKHKLRRNESIGSYTESMKSRVNVTNFPTESEDRFPPPPAGTEHGVKLEYFPPAMSSAPFTYKDLSNGKEYKMAFMGGVTSLIQHKDGSVEPKIGWAVLDRGPAAAS